MRQPRSPIPTLLAVLTLVPQLASAQEPTLLGFGPAGAKAERALEDRFDAEVRRTDIHDWLQRLASRPHHVGSPGGQANAEWLAGLFRFWGYETTIETFDVLFPTPKSGSLEMIAPHALPRARSTSRRSPRTRPPARRAEQLPTYNAYSIDGDVTGELVYVNYGVPADYEELERRGVSVKGKIVIARYGGSWRGIKPKVAAEHGAVGCLIYSDPRDDGYFEGDVYPKGGYRSAAGRAARLGGRHAALSRATR